MALQMYKAVAELERIRSQSKTRDGFRSTLHTTLGITPRGKWKLIPRKSDGSCHYYPDDFHELYYLGVRPYGMLNTSAHLICSQIGRCFQGPGGCGAGKKTSILLEAPKSKVGNAKALKQNASKMNSSMTVFPTAMSSFQKVLSTVKTNITTKDLAADQSVMVKAGNSKPEKPYRQTFLSIQEHKWVLLRSLPENKSELQSRLRALPLELRSIIWSHAFVLSCECSLLAVVDSKKKLNVKKMTKDHREIRAPLMLLRDATFKYEAEKAFYSMHEIIVDAKNLGKLLETNSKLLTAIKVVVGIWGVDGRGGSKINPELELEGKQLQADLYDLMDCPQLKSVKLVICFWSEEHYRPTTWTCDYDWSREADACPCCNRVEYKEIRCKMAVLAEPLLELEQSGLLESVFMRIYYSKPGIYPRHFGPYAMLPMPHPCRHELYSELACEETRTPSCASKRTPAGEDVHDGGEKNFQDDGMWAPMYSYLGFQIYDWIGDAIRSYEEKLCQCRLFARQPHTWYPEYVALAHRILWQGIVEVLAEEDLEDGEEGGKVILQCLSGFSHDPERHPR